MLSYATLPESASPSNGFGSPSHTASTPVQVRVIRTLGHGRAATAELVEAFFEDGRSQRLVEKVFAPGLLTRLIYRIAFASPFAYQSNRNAILASFYRRRVAARMLAMDLPECCVNIAMPAYVRYDRPRKAWVLAAEFVKGRGPIPRSLNKTQGLSSAYSPSEGQSGSDDEMLDLIHAMKKVESQLIETGLVGSGWQVSPNSMVSTANLLIPSQHQLRVFSADTETKQVIGNHRYTIIDLESGIPAVLLWRYLWMSWSRGSLCPFDDLDSKRLQNASELAAARLIQRGEPSDAAQLRQDVAALISHDQQWKTAELAPFRKPWTWLSTQRLSAYRDGCIDRWKLQETIDTQTMNSVQTSVWVFAMVWIAGICLPGSVGRWIQSVIGNQEHRRRVQRFVFDARCRAVFWKRYRAQKIQVWRKQERCDRESQPTSGVSFMIHRVLGWLTPAGVHRYCVDSRRRKRRNCQVIAFLTRGSFQAAWGRKAFETTIRRWQSRGWLDSASASELRVQFDGPQIAVYSRGFGMHLGIKFFYPLLAPLKVGGITVALAGGGLWYAMLPLMLLPVFRTVVTLASLLANRCKGIPHGLALAIGIIPVCGSAAFIVQMWSANHSISALLLREFASRLGCQLPIYGGPDSRTEHLCIAVADRLIRVLR